MSPERNYHHGRLKEELLRSARASLRAKPNEPLSLRGLARELGVSPNAPYRHFPEKDALEVALAAEGFRALALVAEEAIPSKRPLDQLVESVLDFALSEPALFAVVVAERFLGRDPESEVVLARDEWFAALVGVIESEVGSVSAPKRYRRAASVWAILLGVVSLRQHGARGLLLAEQLPDLAALVGTAARQG